jgi:CTP:molybdopterin cytidylyltransferase MocA
MGGYKPLMEIGGVSVARRVAGAFAAAGVAPIVVVTGYRADELEAHLSAFVKDGRGGGPLFVRNGDYASTSMYESAKIGLSRIMGHCARTFFCPVDVPLFTADTVRALMKSGARIVKPIYKGREGHPILIDAKLIPALTGLGRACGAGAARAPEEQAEGRADSEIREGGLKAALAMFENETERVEVDDEGVLYDADTPEDMARLRALGQR